MYRFSYVIPLSSPEFRIMYATCMERNTNTICITRTATPHLARDSKPSLHVSAKCQMLDVIVFHLLGPHLLFNSSTHVAGGSEYTASITLLSEGFVIAPSVHYGGWSCAILFGQPDSSS